MRQFSLTTKEFEEIYAKVPKLTVEMVLETDTGLVMIKRSRGGWVGQWHLPGVTVNYREGLKEAVKRLAQEELGIEVQVERFIYFNEWWSEEKERGFGYSVSLVFAATTNEEIPKINDEDEEVRVFTTLPKNIVIEHREFLEKYWHKERYGSK